MKNTKGPAGRYLENLKARGEPITPKKWQAEAEKLSGSEQTRKQELEL